MAANSGNVGIEDVLLYEPSPQIYLYEHQAADGDGVLECMAVVVMKRDHGLLLGVPRGLLADAEVAAGLVAPMEDMLGPSTVVTCDAAYLADGVLTAAPGRSLSITLLDVSAEVLLRLSPMEPEEPPELLITFDSGSPELLPEPTSLAVAAQAWTTDPSAAMLERVTFYSADEAPGPAGDTGKKPRPRLHLTRADLEASAQKPTTNAAKETLNGWACGPDGDTDGGATSSHGPARWNGPAAAGAQPARVYRSSCPSSTTSGRQSWSLTPVPAIAQVKLGPPPAAKAPMLRPVCAAEEEGQEAEDVEEDPSAQNPLAQAMLAQSQALTSLVQQLATSSADPVLDLGVAGSVGVRGATQRAHFQEELAQGKGLFFRQVLQNRARRMAPSQVAAGSPAGMLEQGLTMSRYWERFGGWANARDMALVAYQVGLIFDAMMGERYDLAKDHLALLAVSLEQCALDGSRMDIGYQLTWLEEPPSSMFMARPGNHPRGRAFAPLASQKWITVVLAYLKELDTIQARRGDAQRPSAPRPPPADPADSAGAPKRKPKRKPGPNAQA